jgi:hypothetical protein
VDGFLRSKGIRFLDRLRTFSGAEHALLGPGRSAGEEHLGRMDVPLRDGALRVAGLELHICLRVPGGRLVRERRVAEVVPSPERLGDRRPLERRPQVAAREFARVARERLRKGSGFERRRFFRFVSGKGICAATTPDRKEDSCRSVRSAGTTTTRRSRCK